MFIYATCGAAEKFPLYALIPGFSYTAPVHLSAMKQHEISGCRTPSGRKWCGGARQAGAARLPSATTPLPTSAAELRAVQARGASKSSGKIHIVRRARGASKNFGMTHTKGEPTTNVAHLFSSPRSFDIVRRYLPAGRG